MSHGDQISSVSDEFEPLARTGSCPFAAIRHRRLPVFGIQFHPEVTHTPMGGQLLKNFVIGVCGCEATWHLEDFAEATIACGTKPGRRPTRDLRTQRWRRLERRRGTAIQGDRPAALLHPDRQRAASQRTSRRW